MEPIYINCLIPYGVIKDEKLTSLEKLILIHLTSLNKTGDTYCWVQINTFAIFIKLVDKQYQRVLIIWSI